nr:tumor necrosis factor receptor superfamily member 5 [Nothobranchius furzeri]
MGLVQYFWVVISALLTLTSPMPPRSFMDGDRMCTECPAGEYFRSCNACTPCSDGSYTTDWNREEHCHTCFRDCSPENHLRVVQNCTSKTPLLCECESGFRCTDTVLLSSNCRQCEQEQHPNATASSGNDKPIPPPGQTEPCRYPRCGRQPESTKSSSNPKGALLAAILIPVVLIGCVALAILFCIHRPRDETCFRQTIAKLCNEEGQDASHRSNESTHPFPGDSFSAKQQPSPLSASSLGPVHVHNPGTVIFSLLSQFTGQVGPTMLGGKRAERASNKEEDDKDRPVFHPTSSPSIHLSEEERSGEIDNIFFPSQEQGKDCHVSKEEGCDDL